MNNDITVKIQNNIPLRGSVSLDSSPYISNFLITLSIVLNIESELKGKFIGNAVQEYTDTLLSRGALIGNYGNSIKINNSMSFSDSSFFSELSLIDKYSMICLLSKKGFVEVHGNQEMLDFYKYLGFVVDEKKDVTIIYNKVKSDRTSITFHKPNVDYFLIAILLFLLNHKKFTISIADLNYELSLIFELLKNFGLVTDITYNEFVSVTFDVEKIKDSYLKKLEVPKNPNDFIFYCICALATNGEIEIEGLNSKFFANSLKIFSDIGAGFDALTDNRIRIWGCKEEQRNKVEITEDSTYLDITKVCLIPLISLNSEEQESRLWLETNSYKPLLQDLNRLGASLKFTDTYVESLEKGRIKSGKIYLDDNLYSNYARVVTAIVSEDSIELNNFQKILHFSSSLKTNLEKLGVKVNVEE